MKEIKIKNKLIVSCQALEKEPLHSPFIMSKMALAAKEGGACGIRANSVKDIIAIKKVVDLPIIGIIKKTYNDSEVFITPTIREIDDLMEASPDIIAMDATNSKRPMGESLEKLVYKVHEKYPNQLLMADCSTVDEMIKADHIGFDFIGTTLVGYTKQSKQDNISANNFRILREAVSYVSHPIIAEGNIDTPEKAKKVLELGAYSVVVGSAITRPQLITKKFVEAIKNFENKV